MSCEVMNPRPLQDLRNTETGPDAHPVRRQEGQRPQPEEEWCDGPAESAFADQADTGAGLIFPDTVGGSRHLDHFQTR